MERIDKNNIRNIQIFCQSANEKKNAILIFASFGLDVYENESFKSGKTWESYPYVYFDGHLVIGNMSDLRSLRLVNFKDIKNLKDFKIKIKVSKWKLCWKEL